MPRTLRKVFGGLFVMFGLESELSVHLWSEVWTKLNNHNNESNYNSAASANYFTLKNSKV